MSGAKKALQLLVLFFGRRGFGGIRPDAFAARVVLRGGEAAFAHMLGGLGGVALVDARRAQILVEPPFAVPARNERSAPRFCKLRVVDIAKLGEMFDQCIYIRRSVVTPATFTDFAVQISGEFGAGSGVFAHIMQRQAAQTRFIKRGLEFLGRPGAVHALFVPQSGRNLNAYRRLEAENNKNVTIGRRAGHRKLWEMI
jgi:hypothetical protein